MNEAAAAEPDTPEAPLISDKAVGYIAMTGHACLVGMLILFVVLYWVYGSPYQWTWQLVLAQLSMGRAGSAHMGLDLGFNRYYLLFQICMHDFILMLYIFPLFVRGFQQLSQIRLIGPSLQRLHDYAQRNQDDIGPFGVLGLLLFVFFPFWNCGPLVGVSLAYVIEMRLGMAFASVILGNIVAVATWVWAYDKLRQYDKTLALVLLLVFFVLAMSWPVYARWRRKRKQAKVMGLSSGKPLSSSESDSRPK
ncbi:MAG TPA: small multi-drug export protein [Candidatus Hydrogenedentes bacterium]|nr:small multi-drug export protein [Candidatus Hydrogenedentota bacterium]